MASVLAHFEETTNIWFVIHVLRRKRFAVFQWYFVKAFS